MSPLDGNGKALQNKDLPDTKPAVDRKTDSRKANQAENQAQILPPDLAEIAAVWPKLPEHIKAAINALVQTCIQGD